MPKKPKQPATKKPVKKPAKKPAKTPVKRASRKPAVATAPPLEAKITTAAGPIVTSTEEPEPVVTPKASAKTKETPQTEPPQTEPTQAEPPQAAEEPIATNPQPETAVSEEAKPEPAATLPEGNAPKADNAKAEAVVPAPAAAAQPAARPPKRKKPAIILTLVIIGLLAVLSAGYMWHRQQASSPGRLAAANRQLVAEVAERAVLPEDETPTVTTVVDKDKANQSFLANAANGDKVLLYFQSGRAVLYRPSTKQIVNIGPLSQPPAQVFLRDGRKGEIPASIRRNLSQPAGFNVTSQDASAKVNYTKTLVIDLAGNRPDLAARAAKLVGGSVAQLPAGESRPDADILVIVGSDAR